MIKSFRLPKMTATRAGGRQPASELPSSGPGRKGRSRKKAAPSQPKISLGQRWQAVKGQFQGLDPNEPARWPVLPRMAAWIVVGLLGMALVWLAMVRDQSAALTDARAQEDTLRGEYRTKLVQAVNIDSLQAQKRQVEDFVQQLEKQLPSKAEMAALLSDINQAGMSQGLKFELFRPGAEIIKDYYAELPIAIRVKGKYEQLGHFASELANLSRIVTLESVTIAVPTISAAGTAAVPAHKSDAANPDLVMDATARTYRYLDAAEVQAQRNLKDGNKTAGAKR